MEHQELADWLRLLLTPGVGNTSARRLLAAFGLPTTVLAQSPEALATHLSPTQTQALCNEPADLQALVDITWDWLTADTASRRILPLGDPLYPQSLLQIEDPPLLLYAMGMPAAWSHNLLNTTSNCLAVVGSRNPSPQGTANARQFAQALAEAGLTIVSGLALGIDGAAHEGALLGADHERLATVAVIGTGLDRVYPSRHRALAHRIAEQGILLSEYPLGTAPLAANFPRRNRIISGLSRGTLVVEAALQSGSLITANLATEQGREVFAIPGSIHSTQAHGCHALIKQGAKLVESAQDVLEELDWQDALQPSPATTPSRQTPSTQTHESAEPAELARAVTPVPAPRDSALLQALGFDPVGLDALQARTGLPTPDLLAQLMALELQGQVARLSGGLFQRQAQA